MIPVSKGQKAVRACTIRLLTLISLYISQLMIKSCLECQNDKNLQPIHIIVLQILSLVILSLAWGRFNLLNYH